MSLIGDKKSKLNNTNDCVGSRNSIEMLTRECVEDSLTTPESPYSSGPFPHTDDADSEAAPSLRQFDCDNYDSCLSTSAALNWNDFTCNSCDGTVNESLLSLAKSAAYFDPVLSHLGVKHAKLILKPTLTTQQRSEKSSPGRTRRSSHPAGLRLVTDSDLPE